MLMYKIFLFDFIAPFSPLYRDSDVAFRQKPPCEFAAVLNLGIDSPSLDGKQVCHILKIVFSMIS